MDFDMTVASHNIKKKAGEAPIYTVAFKSKDPDATLTLKSSNISVIHAYPRGDAFTVKIVECEQQKIIASEKADEEEED